MHFCGFFLFCSFSSPACISGHCTSQCRTIRVTVQDNARHRAGQLHVTRRRTLRVTVQDNSRHRAGQLHVTAQDSCTSRRRTVARHRAGQLHGTVQDSCTSRCRTIRATLQDIARHCAGLFSRRHCNPSVRVSFVCRISSCTCWSSTCLASLFLAGA